MFGSKRSSVVVSTWIGIIAVICALLSNETFFLVVADILWDILNYLDGGNDAFQHNTMLQFDHYKPVPFEGIHYNLPILVGKDSLPHECNGAMIHIGPNQKYWRRKYTKHSKYSQYNEYTQYTNKDENTINGIKYDLGKHHWFDGDGMIHVIKMNSNNQSVDYSNSWLMTPKLKKETKLQRSIYLSLAGNMIDNGFWGALKGLWLLFIAFLPISPFKLDSLFKIGPTNTATLNFNNRLFALTENSFPFEFTINQNNLSIKSFDFNQIHASWDVPLSSHPKYDSNTNELLLFGYNVVYSHVSIGILNQNSQTLHGSNINLNHAQLMHDISMTKDYFILIDTNLWAGPDMLLKHGSIMKYEKYHKSRVGFIKRNDLLNTKPLSFKNNEFMSNVKTDNVPIIWIEIEPCMIFHTANAWNDLNNSNIVTLIAPRITHSEFISTFQHTNKINLMLSNNYNLSKMAPGLPNLYQWKFDLSNNKLISSKQLLSNDMFVEFPIIHEKRNGIKPDTIYMTKMGVNFDNNGNNENNQYGGYLGTLSNIKYNVNDGTFKEIIFGNNRVSTGEPIFIPKDKSGNDDSIGYLANIIYNYQTKQTTFELFNATSMDNNAIFVAKLPYRVPAGFHSDFITQFDFDQISF